MEQLTMWAGLEEHDLDELALGYAIRLFTAVEESVRIGDEAAAEQSENARKDEALEELANVIADMGCPAESIGDCVGQVVSRYEMPRDGLAGRVWDCGCTSPLGRRGQPPYAGRTSR